MKKLALTSLMVFSMIAAHSAHADSEELTNPDNGHSYKRFDTAKTWGAAKSACESQGSHLATITSEAENTWVKSKFFTGLWLGGSDAVTEGKWKWITGEAWDYSIWYPGEPNNSGDEDVLQSYGSGNWNDLTNSFANLLPYLCEWEQPRNTYSQVITLPDINYNGSPDFALIGGLANNYMLFIYDGESQEIINKTVIQEKLNNYIKSINVIPDQNKNGAPELSIVIGNNNTSLLQLQDTLTGDVLNKTTLSNSYSRTILLPDINANGSRDFALMGESGNDYLLFVYDGSTQVMIKKSVIIEKSDYIIKSAVRAKDSNNNNAPEVAILITKVSDGSAILQFQDTLTGSVLKKITLPNQ